MLALIQTIGAYICLVPIYLYRKCISPFIAPRCRFYPTCSSYAMTVLKQQPMYKALGLIAWRMLRCQPLCKGGVDEPPLKMKNKG